MLQVIPQYENTLVEYTGTLLEDNYVSFVDASLNSGDPCALGVIAAATADSSHTGPIQGRGAVAPGVDCCSGSGKVLKIPQDEANTKLDSAKTFAACYSDGNDASATWYDSGIRVKVSRIFTIEAYDVKHRTEGTLPSHSSLTMRYDGPLLYDRWISLVDETLNGNDPCGLGTVAASPKDAAHSGSRLATDNVFEVDTASLSATIIFAVCYAQSGGIASSQWQDTGIRLKRSKVTGVTYGVDTDRFGVGFARTTVNPNPDDNRNLAVDKIPQIANVKLEYQGDLDNDMWISLVDDSLMDPDGTSTEFTTSVGNPCAYPAVAAAGASTSASGAAQASQLSGAAGGAVVTILQGILLDASKTYAVCYAEGDGSAADSSWSDSYIRFQISKIETVGHHSALHTTTGILPNTGVGYAVAASAENLVLTYTGSLGAGTTTGDIVISLVDADLNVVTSNGISVSQPCLDATVAGQAEDGSGQYSGPIAADDGETQAQIQTSVLHTGTIESDDTLTEKVFALCYCENGADTGSETYADSGIRLTVGKIQQILHGTPTDAPYAPRGMLPVLDTMLTSGLASAQNVIPQAADQV